VTLLDALSFELWDLDRERPRARFTIDDRHRQPVGVVHGGVYSALAETLASVATAESVGGDMAVFGMSNVTNFLRTLTEGTVEAEASAVHSGRTTWVWDVKLVDEQGRVVAVSRVTVAVRPPR
jgi:1,4-dihydroxy-2-naphthoyl-CoA hydrolase